MKKEVSPVIAIAAAVAVIAVAGFALWRSEHRSPPPGDTSGMPPQVGAELKRRMGTIQQPPSR